MVQEPWTNHGKILGLNIKGYKLLYATSTGNNIRACILAKDHLNIFILSDYSDEDTVVAAWETKSTTYWLLSCYMAHDHGDNPPNDLVRKVLRDANRRRIPVVICADANAHHLIWGSSDTNTRGECLFEFILDSNLVVANRGSEPTFVVANRKEVLDITLISLSYADSIVDWRVSKDCSFSDHLYLEFSIVVGNRPKQGFMNRRNTNWDIQRMYLQDVLSDPPRLGGPDDIDRAVNMLTSALNIATKRSCRIRDRKCRNRPPWWDPDIAETRRNCRRLFNEAKRTGNWTSYKSSLNRFKNQVRNAKRESWRNFCSGVEGSSETSRLRKILSKTSAVPSFLQKANGEWTTSSQETLEVLLEAHFPGCRSVNEASHTLRACTRGAVSVPIDHDRISWAINSFEPYKSPGPDEVIPADLQRNADRVIPWLISIFDACLSLTYVPKLWTECKVVFIPKGGKSSHVKAKDFRPISLTSFLLKTLERVIDIHVRLKVDRTLLSPSQHAYTRGKSVETAMHTLVGFIERSLEFRNYALVAFLDIEGAFNNVEPDSIVSALKKLGLEDDIIGFVNNLLKHRIIVSSLGVSSISKFACRGTPQGGVLSPLLWNLTINSLLMRLDSLGYRTIAYADDVAVAVSGIDLNTLSQRLENALNVLSTWSNRNGLGVNPSKTELVLFSGKYKIPPFSLPKLNGVSLALSDSAKYLGLILDRKLSWNLNVRARASKALMAIYVCKKAIGLKWGMNPSQVSWLYETVVKPIMLYVASVWWKALDKMSLCYDINKVMRTSAVLVTGAMRSTPTKALFAMLNWLPANLLVRQTAINTAIRLSAAGDWRERTYGHSSILRIIDDLPDHIDYCIPTPFFDRKFGVIFQGNADLELDPNCMWIYTDCSKNGNQVGGGFFIEETNTSVSFRLPDGCSILQAELSAIKRATNWLTYYRISDRNIRIVTDSQPAIKSLIGVYSTSTLVHECRASLNGMARHSNLTLIWVKGHGVLRGNIVADSLAKRGSMMDDDHIDRLCGVPLSFCKLHVK